MMRALLVLVLALAACGDAGPLRAPERGPERSRPYSPELPNLDEAQSRGAAAESPRQSEEVAPDVITPDSVCRELCTLASRCSGVPSDCVSDCTVELRGQSPACQAVLLRYARCYFGACPASAPDPDSCLTPQDAELLRRC